MSSNTNTITPKRTIVEASHASELGFESTATAAKITSQTKPQVKPTQTIVHYKYRLFLELGLDPYEGHEKVWYDCDTWPEVCQGIFTHLGQSMDKRDENIRHCGKWYVTNHGRGKILQVIDFYEYEYDSDTEYVIQNNHLVDPTLVDTEDYYADLKREREIQQTEKNEKKSEDSSSESEDSSSESVDMYHHIIKGANRSDLGRTANKCIDDVLSCAIL
jgi:hypothetical protein